MHRRGRTIFEANHKVDLVTQKQNSASGNVVAFDRLRGGGEMLTVNSTAAESSDGI